MTTGTSAHASRPLPTRSRTLDAALARAVAPMRLGSQGTVTQGRAHDLRDLLLTEPRLTATPRTHAAEPVETVLRERVAPA